MSQEILAQVVERASTDAAFRAQLRSDPEGALAGYDLTADERAALRHGPRDQPGSSGVDRRVSKMDTWQEQNDAMEFIKSQMGP